MSDAMFTIQQLSKSFGMRALLDIENVSLESGTLYVLTGDNGSGKSTLLRMLAGLEPADSLVLSFAREKANEFFPSAWRRDIIHVHQHPYLFHSSIADNIAYGLKMRGMASAERQSHVKQAMSWAGLDVLADVPPKRLSGGERQKVALARAKVLEPKVLLVDEPTANLDRHARAQIVALLQKTVAEQRTVVVACHDREIIDLPGAVRLNLEDGKLSITK
ncbi:MAG: ATP-binding cassette domain-containing protein [Pseudomonadota bacterium]